MRNTFIMLIMGFLRGMYFYLPIFTLYLVGYDISLANIIFSQTFYSLLKFAGEVPTGLFADRYGQRTSIILGYALEALGIAVVVLYPTVIGVYACYAIGGLAASFLSGSEEALLFESAKHERRLYGKTYAAFLSNQTIGMVVATAIGGITYAQFGADAYRPLLIATVIAIALCSLLALTLRSFQAKIDDPSVGSGAMGILRRSVSLLRSNDTLRTLAIVGMLMLSGEYYLYNAYQVVFTDVHVPPLMFGLALSGGLALNALVTRYVYHLERWLTLDKILLLIGSLLALCYVVLGITDSAIIAVIAFIAALGLIEVQSPIVSDYVNERISSDIRSTVLSGMSFVTRVATVVMRVILASAVALAGMQVSLITQGGYLIVGSFVAYWLLVRCGCAHRIKKHTSMLS